MNKEQRLLLKGKGAFRRLVTFYGILFLGMLIVSTAYCFYNSGAKCYYVKEKG